MSNTNCITLRYDVPGDDFTRAGEASADLKERLKKLGFPSTFIRRTSIAMYEGEINLAIHAGGGQIEVVVCPQNICITVQDKGPGIADIDLAMSEGYSSAPDEVRSLGFGAGMGLPNIKKNADEFELTSTVGEGTRLYIEIKR